jgi:hypothetical protein
LEASLDLATFEEMKNLLKMLHSTRISGPTFKHAGWGNDSLLDAV